MRFKEFLAKPNKYVIFSIIAVSVFLIYRWADSTKDVSFLAEGQIYRGEVLKVINAKEVPSLAGNRTSIEQTLRASVEFPDGTREVEVLNDFVPVKPGIDIYVKGSAVGTPDESFFLMDIIRTKGLIWLAILFVAITLIISRLKGFYALVGLLFSFAIIFSYVIPQILKGSNPVSAGLIGSLLILVVAIYSSHGFNRKSLSALFGISLTLVAVGLMANYFTQALYFTGYGGEESLYLNLESEVPLNLVGLVVAGIIIAAIGILDDIAITQASIVFRLRKASSELKAQEIFTHALDIGKDHIAAVINTLVLAYVGAALPLLLLLSLQNFPLAFTINNELIAVEIARTLIASCGLILSVPLTTLIAVWLSKSNNS
jgi:uncharacterized membrane protein